MSSRFTEETVELATLDYFRELGYTVAHGPDIEPEAPAARAGAASRGRDRPIIKVLHDF